MTARRKRGTVTEEDLRLMDELSAGRDIPNASAWVRRFARRLRRTLAPLDAEVEHRITTVVEDEARTPRSGDKDDERRESREVAEST